MYSEGTPLHCTDISIVDTDIDLHFLRRETDDMWLVCPTHDRVDDCFYAPGEPQYRNVGCLESMHIHKHYLTLKPLEEVLNMSDLSVEQKLDNLDLSEDDAFLVEYGILEKDGRELTDVGKRIVLKYAFKSVKTDLIAGLRKAMNLSDPATAKTPVTEE